MTSEQPHEYSGSDWIAAHRYEFPTVSEIPPAEPVAGQRDRVIASILAIPDDDGPGTGLRR